MHPGEHHGARDVHREPRAPQQPMIVVVEPKYLFQLFKLAPRQFVLQRREPVQGFSRGGRSVQLDFRRVVVDGTGQSDPANRW